MLWFILQLFVVIFNKTSYINKKIYFEVGENYQLELNVSNINVVKKEENKKDCALIPKDQLPKHELLW